MPSTTGGITIRDRMMMPLKTSWIKLAVKFLIPIFISAALAACSSKVDYVFCGHDSSSTYQEFNGDGVVEFFIGRGVAKYVEYSKLGRRAASRIEPYPISSDGKNFSINNLIVMRIQNGKIAPISAGAGVTCKFDDDKISDIAIDEVKSANLICRKDDIQTISKFVFFPKVGIFEIEMNCEGCNESQLFKLTSSKGLARICPVSK